MGTTVAQVSARVDALEAKLDKVIGLLESAPASKPAPARTTEPKSVATRLHTAIRKTPKGAQRQAFRASLGFRPLETVAEFLARNPEFTI